MKGAVVRSVEAVCVCLLLVIWGNNLLFHLLVLLNISLSFQYGWVIWRVFPKVISIIFVVGMAQFLYKASFSNLGLTPFSVKRWMKGFVFGSLSVAAILYAYSYIYQVPFGLNKLGDAIHIGLGLIIVAFLAISEELLFRGFVLRLITAKSNAWAGVAFSSVLFGLFHLFNPGFNLVIFLLLVGIGIFYALYKLLVDKGSLWGVIGFHMAWNFTQEFIIRTDIPKGLINIFGTVLIFILMLSYILIRQVKRGGIRKSIKAAENIERKALLINRSP